MTESVTRQVVARALADFEFFCAACVKIKAKDGRVVPLILNREQKELVRAVETRMAARKPVLVAVLKSRQVGVSTLIEARLLWRALRGDGAYRGIVLAHEKEAARRIFGIARFAVDNLPEWFKLHTGFKEEYHTKYELSFAHTGSSIYVTSADSKEPGRSGTINLVHLSEAGFYDDAESLVEALFAAVPLLDPNTEVYVESTGNGLANWFYNTFWAAWNGKSDYTALFWPWYVHDEYRMPVPENVQVDVPDEYSDLVERGDVTLEQLWWRQWQLNNVYSGDVSRFAREFPATPMEAFTARTSSVFNQAAVASRLREVEGLAPWEGFLVRTPETSVISFHHAPRERLRVFKPPEAGRQYVVGVDVASGVSPSGDASVACVLDVASGEQVAVLWVNNMEPLQFAHEVKLLGEWCGTALIAPEVTDGHGLSVANWLRDEGYCAIYRRRVFDKTTNSWTHRIGWRTDKRTKGMIVDALRDDFVNGSVTVNDAETLKEMQTFVQHDDGSLGAVAGAHDDRVMALAIANQVRREAQAVAMRPAGTQQASQPQPIQQSGGGLLRRPPRGQRRGPEVEGLGSYA